MVKQQPDKYHFQHLSTSFTTGEWSALKPQKPHQRMRKDHRWSDNIWHDMDGTWWNSREHFQQASRHNTFSYLILKRRHALAQMRLVAMSWSVSSTFSDWRAQIILAHSNNGETAARQVSLSTSFNKLYHWWVVSVETTSKDLERSQMIRHRTRQGKHCYTGKPYPHDIKLFIWLMFVRVRIRLTTGGQQTFKNPIAFHIHISLTWQVHGQPWLAKCWFHQAPASQSLLCMHVQSCSCSRIVSWSLHVFGGFMSPNSISVGAASAQCHSVTQVGKVYPL